MCLILVAWRVHGNYPLAIAANRGEYFSRPAERAHWWSDEGEILAGRDLLAWGQAGGQLAHHHFLFRL
jgi:uncharacterized protein with NRDE domain